MTASAPPDDLIQPVRDLSTSRTGFIPTHLDKDTEEYFVLWDDILDTFKNAEYIKCNGEVVLFMVDDNFEHLLPLRICYHPGVTLEVVSGTCEQTITEPPPTPTHIESIHNHCQGSDLTLVITEQSTHTWSQDKDKITTTRSSRTVAAIEYTQNHGGDKIHTTSILRQLFVRAKHTGGDLSCRTQQSGSIWASVSRCRGATRNQQLTTGF
ncbi:MAG: hypothetical protein J3Q66DRAFT_324764 [Benniella sp.]|nr:MAG: hypothetical protein J3Q66DRAFT_324764 [Benniella sp.]